MQQKYSIWPAVYLTSRLGWLIGLRIVSFIGWIAEDEIQVKSGKLNHGEEQPAF